MITAFVAIIALQLKKVNLKKEAPGKTGGLCFIHNRKSQQIPA
jgi:hypothetical protein